jgi:mannosyl-3-phosphoglycerate phosphatase
MSLPLPILVFSDVDDVLGLPDAQACADAAKALTRLERDDVPLVLCSSKTRVEIEGIQQTLGIHHPFVCESGGAAFIPAGYFPFEVPKARGLAGYQAVEFGWPYAEVVQALHRTAGRLRIEIVGFHEMSVEDVARDCDLPLLQARLAKLREYGERFRVIDPNETTRSRLIKALETARLGCIAGERYDQVGATVDASIAVSVLRALYKRALGVVLTVGSADATANQHVLQFFNRRVVVSRDDRKHGINVVGWAEAIVDVVERLRRQTSPLSS